MMTATVVAYLLSVLQQIVVILVVMKIIASAVIKMIIVCLFVIASMTSPALPAAAVVTLTPHLSHQHLQLSPGH